MHWVRRKVANVVKCSIWLERDRVWRIERKRQVVGVGQKREKRGGRAVESVGKWMSTLGVRPHHGGLAQPSSCVARHVAARAKAALLRRQSTPPAQHCSEPYPPSLGFCKIRPKFELEPKLHQNESCAKFYKLQIIFW